MVIIQGSHQMITVHSIELMSEEAGDNMPLCFFVNHSSPPTPPSHRAYFITFSIFISSPSLLFIPPVTRILRRFFALTGRRRKSMHVQCFGPGEPVTQEGEMEECFYFINNGEVAMSKAETKITRISDQVSSLNQLLESVR
jgi:hypothetical protein